MEEKSDWRARIGILSPITNFITISEWNSVLPDGVTVHEALMGLTETTPETLVEMRKQAVSEAIKLSYGLMDIILFGCTSASFIGGPGYDEEIIKELETATGIPSTTTSTCVLTAFADLGVKKIALIGPYIREVFDAEIQFFAGHGIETVHLKAMEYQYVRDISLLREKPYIFYRMAKEAYNSSKDCDSIFITCMASPAIKIIDILEQEMGRYVLSSSSASLYGVLKKLGIKGPIEGYGKLLRML